MIFSIDYKLIDVIRVSNLPAKDSVAREMALIKVNATSQTRSEIIQIVAIFRAAIVDVSTDSLIIEITGVEEKIDSLSELLKPSQYED